MHISWLAQRDMHTVGRPYDQDWTRFSIVSRMYRLDSWARSSQAKTHSAWMQEERCEVLARRQLNKPIAEVRDQTG
jgi:hypothetical protein